eukprot:CAMPEP_0171276820 /NCGR_PEP_ID=MMETSP0790-20130122/64038_1 /TAXON_ID=2925 /ORGANISM="Alexandrium catenella, Strain OF101" /LENGTH=90 /DNA_ID=CAMNT_0011745933 /DNA_START=144 /DNA_END=413 /DNA_ORIENTATION=+
MSPVLALDGSVNQARPKPRIYSSLKSARRLLHSTSLSLSSGAARPQERLNTPSFPELRWAESASARRADGGGDSNNCWRTRACSGDPDSL